MMRYPSLPLVILLFGLAACSSGEEPARPDSKEDAPPPDHVWKDQTDTLDRAGDVQQTLDEAEEERRKALEEQGG